MVHGIFLFSCMEPHISGPQISWPQISGPQSSGPQLSVNLEKKKGIND
jgi:hypothetical protein